MQDTSWNGVGEVDGLILLSNMEIFFITTFIFSMFVIQLFSKGFGLPIFLGLIGVVSFFYNQIASGTASEFSLVLLVVGIGLIVMEHFTLGGVAGLTGIVSVIVSFVLAIGDAGAGITITLLALLFSSMLFLIVRKVFKKEIQLYRALVLEEKLSSEKGFVSSSEHTELVGVCGTTATQLRPAGIALVNGLRLDVVSVGSFIESGVRIEVVEVSGGRIVVEEMK